MPPAAHAPCPPFAKHPRRAPCQLPVTGGRVGVMTYGGIVGFQELELWDVGSVTKTYSSGGQRVALRRDGTLYYVHTDHLGSTSLLTDATGAEVAGTRLKYFAYGAPRPGAADATHNAFARGYTPATYTGQTRDASTGLMYYGARWYDPANIGKDGVSAYCEGCGNNLPPKFWGHSVGDLQDFARQLGLDPSKAAVYTPEYGGTGHYSLFIDAIGPDGYILPQYADLIDAFLRSAK